MKLLTFLKKLGEAAPQVDMSDEGRMSRAQAMGFDTSQVWYHGSPQRDLTGLDPSAPKNANIVGDIEGMYFTTEPSTASGYSRPRSSWGQAGKGGPRPPRGQIYSVYLRMQNPLDITPIIKKLQRRKEPFNVAKQAALMSVDRSKHDGVIFHGNAMNTPEAIVFDPKNVRSVDAPFVTDDSPMLMASLGESQPTRPPAVAYHATFPDNRDNIRMHGLDPKYSDTFEEGAVFFATGGTPDPRMDIWKADLSGLDIEYDPTQEGGDREHWWYTHQHVVPDRLTLVQKGTG